MAAALYEAIAARRLGLDTRMWQVPGLALAADAFLFTLALDPGSARAARLLASLLALVVAVISMQLMARHRHLELLDSRLLEEFERTNGLRMHGVLPHADPSRRREALGVSRGAFAGQRSYRLWMGGLLVFALASLAVVALTLVAPGVLA